MRVDPATVQIATSALIPATAALACIRLRLLQIFAVHLFGFLVLDGVLLFLGFGGELLWVIHMPSAAVLGWDEILERHGVWVSTILHFADLVFWSAILSIPMAVQLSRERTQRQKNAEDNK